MFERSQKTESKESHWNKEEEWTQVDVEKEEQSYFASTPFHVRFGKTKIFRSSQQVVEININGKPVDLKMKLGKEGVAYFVLPYNDLSEESTDCNMLTSPLIVPIRSRGTE